MKIIILQDSRSDKKMKGVGRGNLLKNMRKKMLEEQELKEKEERKLREQEELEKQKVEQNKPEETCKSIGRGILLQKLHKLHSDSSSTTASTSSVTSTHTTPTLTSQGRGALLNSLMNRSTAKTFECSGEVTGVLGNLSSLSLEETSVVSEPEVVSRQGVAGKPINLSSNFINIKTSKDKGIYQYEVKFLPNIDSTYLKSKLLNQHLNALGNVKAFDGQSLYLPIKLQEKATIFKSVHPVDESIVRLTVLFKKKQFMKENISFFNNLMNRVMRAMELVKIGRNSYNPLCAHQIPQHRMELWPGYITSISELEGGLKLNLDASHRVVRVDTVRDMMGDIFHNNPNNFKIVVEQEILGTSVLTRYNNRTYVIDDIQWNETPMYKFKQGDREISLFDYYKQHHSIVIKDLKQPLLIHRYKKKNSNGETIENESLLIPELCFLVGFTDSVIKDFNITRDLAKITRINPDQRRLIIRKFIEQVNSNELTKNIFLDWGLELESDTINLKGRVLDPEEITFGNKTMISNDADWTKCAVNSKVLRTPNMMNWVIICTQRNKKNCEDFLQTFQAVCNKICILIGQPKLIYLRDDKTETYVGELRNILKSNSLDMVVIIFPSIRNDKYTAVKKVCCIEYPVASQVIISKTISRPDKIKSVTEKIAMQMNCKLGGALWALKNPFSNVMVCGIDVFHEGVNQRSKRSVAAFTASLDKMLSTWHSRVCLQGVHQELIDSLKQCLVSALKVYRERNDKYPDRILIYRDGVGDGQLDTIRNYEVKQLLETCSLIDPSYKPKLSVIIVQKRINTRIFVKAEELGNPPPGTIVDSDITRRYLYDFYLVPQVIKQGTVTPTHFIVVYDGAELKTDHMQRFTFKLCHLYYNWSGTIRVPAPCQYAHKLAYLVGQHLRIEPSSLLNNQLYYL